MIDYIENLKFSDDDLDYLRSTGIFQDDFLEYLRTFTFTGDIYVNIHGMTREQAEYNKYAPVLMTSVDTDPEMCAKERKNFFQRLGEGDWKIFGAHGEMKEYRLHID